MKKEALHTRKQSSGVLKFIKHLGRLTLFSPSLLLSYQRKDENALWTRQGPFMRQGFTVNMKDSTPTCCKTCRVAWFPLLKWLAASNSLNRKTDRLTLRSFGALCHTRLPNIPLPLSFFLPEISGKSIHTVSVLFPHPCLEIRLSTLRLLSLCH